MAEAHDPEQRIVENFNIAESDDENEDIKNVIKFFKKIAKGNGEVDKSPIIIATCSAKQKMCTYYMVRRCILT